MVADLMQYHETSWKEPIPSNIAGNYVVLFNGNATNNRNFRVNYFGQTYNNGGLHHVGNNNHKVLFQTIQANLTFKQSDNSDQTGYAQIKKNNVWNPFGNNSGNITGSETMELLPGSYAFNVTYLGKVHTRNGFVISPTQLEIPFNTVAANVNFKTSQNTDQIGYAEVQYGDGSWNPFGMDSGTVIGNATMELLPVNHSFRMNYFGKRILKNADLSTNDAQVFFNTVPANLTFVSSQNSGLVGYATAQHGDGSWQPFGANAGVLDSAGTMEFLPTTHNFRMTYNNATHSINSVNLSTTSDVAFQTAAVIFRAIAGGNNEPLNGVNVEYNSWYLLGQTGSFNSGQVYGEFLPTKNNFRAIYPGSSTQTKSNFIPALNVINYVDFTFNNAFAMNMEKANTVNNIQIDMYPNPVQDQLAIVFDYNGKVEVEIFSVDGRKLLQQTENFGNIRMDVSSLNAGNYIVVIKYDNKVESRKLSK